MGKDFRIGLLLGLLLAVVTLVWVATRPSLRPQARAAGSQDFGFQIADCGLNESAPQDAPRTAQDTLRVTQDEGQDAAPPQARRGAGDKQPAAQGTAADPQSEIRDRNSFDSALPDQTIYERSEKIQTTRFHIVRRGETLSAISRQYYGTPNEWRKILTANQETIKDPDRITPGTKLILP